uniref:Immunoglobulin V-set domain-containing protein n=1 Tax=Sus scrofa TaxID=9823 RepID=A0A4X1V0J9_PIG
MLRQDYRSVLILPCFKSAISSDIFLLAQGRSSKKYPTALHCLAMNLVSALVCMTLFALREVQAQSVTQPDSHITVPEGDPPELRCNYSSSFSTYLFWYMQYPNQGLQLLLKYMSGKSLVSGIKGFEAEFKKNETSFHLRKTSSHWSDSAKAESATSCAGCQEKGLDGRSEEVGMRSR